MRAWSSLRSARARALRPILITTLVTATLAGAAILHRADAQDVIVLPSQSESTAPAASDTDTGGAPGFAREENAPVNASTTTEPAGDVYVSPPVPAANQIQCLVDTDCVVSAATCDSEAYAVNKQFDTAWVAVVTAKGTGCTVRSDEDVRVLVTRVKPVCAANVCALQALPRNR